MTLKTKRWLVVLAIVLTGGLALMPLILWWIISPEDFQ